jgi:hypothetical protein
MHTNSLKSSSLLTVAGLATALALALPAPAARAASPDINCRMDYHLTGWSLVYKHTTGTGVVTCDNGATMNVRLSARAVGATVGKWKIDNGVGRFSDVHNIREVLGNYAQANANAAVVKAAEAQVLTKGNVSLALAGGGEGIALGVDVGTLHIDPAK